MWIISTLGASLCFAVVHIIDEYCVDTLFKRPWMGVVTSSVTSLVVFLPLPFIIPLIGWDWPSAKIVLIALSSGVLVQISQMLYFYALSNTNAGMIAAYWNLIPAMLPILSYFLLGRTLTTNQYIGIIILIFASNLLLLSDYHLRTRSSAFFLMIGASLAQAFAYLMQDYVYSNTYFISGYTLFTFGIIATGVIPLIFKKVRLIFVHSPQIKRFSFLFLLVEGINLIALALAQKAIAIGNPSLVAAAESTIPGFTFVIGIMSLPFIKMTYGIEIISSIEKKIASLILMMIGIYLLS